MTSRSPLALGTGGAAEQAYEAGGAFGKEVIELCAWREL